MSSALLMGSEARWRRDKVQWTALVPLSSVRELPKGVVNPATALRLTYRFKRPAFKPGKAFKDIVSK
jgi:hypothetical protein